MIKSKEIFNLEQNFVVNKITNDIYRYEGKRIVSNTDIQMKLSEEFIRKEYGK